MVLSNFEVVLHILFGMFLTLYSQTEWIQLLARFEGLILSRFFNRRGLWRCYRCCLSCFLLRSERLPALSTICLFGCLSRVWRFVRRLSFVICLNISLPFIQLLLFEQDTSVFYFNSHFSKCIRAYRGWSRSSFACNQNIKEEVLFCFKTKRKINWSSTKTSTQRASNIRERTEYNV